MRESIITVLSLIEKASNSDAFWQLLSDAIAGGPFDGGCLMCAEALKRIFGGKLAYISNGKRATHYGLLLDDAYYDFDGCHNSAKQWIATFSANEYVHSSCLSVMHGRCPRSNDIPYDEKVVSSLVALFNSLAK